MDDAAEGIPKPRLPGWNGGADGQLSLNELLPWLYDAFFLPGDWLIWATAAYLPSVAELLEIGDGDYGGTLSGYLSAFAWLALALAIAIAYQWVRDTDRALTRALVDLRLSIVRRWRIAAAQIASAWRRRKRASAPAFEVRVDLPLSREELCVLQLHAELQPGYALAISDVASALDAGKHDAARMLERLRMLGLISTTIGGLEGESAYTLTRAGRAFLVLRQMAPKQHRPVV